MRKIRRCDVLGNYFFIRAGGTLRCLDENIRHGVLQSSDDSVTRRGAGVRPPALSFP